MRKFVLEMVEDIEEQMVHMNWEDEIVYADFLAQTYYFVRHSVKMLGLAISKFQHVDNEYQKRFINHMKEEQDHEKMALADLRALGHSLEHFPEKPQTKSFWQTQYYYLQNEDPLSIMGYITFLEQIPVTTKKSIYQRLSKAYPKSTLFFKVHANEDIEHIEKAYELIEKLPDDRKKKIVKNMQQAAYSYSQILKFLDSKDAVQPLIIAA